MKPFQFWRAYPLTRRSKVSQALHCLDRRHRDGQRSRRVRTWLAPGCGRPLLVRNAGNGIGFFRMSGDVVSPRMPNSAPTAP
jgi:hypothetical protein